MKKYSLALLFLGFTAGGQAQNASVEKSLYGIQTGYLGIWVHNEHKLTNSLALRSEIGLEAGIFKGNLFRKTGYEIVPVITLEPRWYYNLGKRLRKDKSIANNSGNFVSLQVNYYPGWFVIANYNIYNPDSVIDIIPTWSIRRSIGSHFNFEAGIGVGYQHIFAKQAGYGNDENNATVNLNLRIGYSF
jgi:hypothetical protein